MSAIVGESPCVYDGRVIYAQLSTPFDGIVSSLIYCAGLIKTHVGSGD